MLQFYLINQAQKQLDLYIASTKKVSLFDYFKGLPSFFKTMPPSFHFYPKAKKVTKP